MSITLMASPGAHPIHGRHAAKRNIPSILATALPHFPGEKKPYRIPPPETPTHNIPQLDPSHTLSQAAPCMYQI